MFNPLMRILILVLFIFSMPFLTAAQLPDSASRIAADSTVTLKTGIGKINGIDSPMISGNRLLNDQAEPVPIMSRLRNHQGKETLFYVLAAMVLMLALLRYIFPRYFSNMFRVFFNNSLRQSQLTDQLLQAKLPSLFFNLFFVVSGGLFSYFLLSSLHWINSSMPWCSAAICIGVFGIAYIIKFGTLKFTGWITGYEELINTYIFIIFLISKIIGIMLVPFILIMAFSDHRIIQFAIPISLVIVTFMLILRFIRSYGLLQYKLSITRFHFFMYILGIEILPLALVYRGLMFLLDKNL